MAGHGGVGVADDGLDHGQGGVGFAAQAHEGVPQAMEADFDYGAVVGAGARAGFERADAAVGEVLLDLLGYGALLPQIPGGEACSSSHGRSTTYPFGVFSHSLAG